MDVTGAIKSLLKRPAKAVKRFNSWSYLRHTQRRQEHLATLGLDLAGKRVLEVGAGIGDHTTFFLDRGCRVVTSDGRADNCDVMRDRFKGRGDVDVRLIDLDQPAITGLRDDERFEIVYCYGTLYHLARPAEALAWLAARCTNLFLLELCVSYGEDEAINLVKEVQHSHSQAVSGTGCRPTRPWVMNRLKDHLPHVYATRTQPWHPEFPTDWTAKPAARQANGEELLTRAVFVAARAPLTSPALSSELLMQQTRA